MPPPEACYTSAFVRRGRVRLGRHHVERLVRDARGLGLGALDPEACARALLACAREAFAAGEGVVRLEVRPRADGAVELIATPRAAGADPARWSAIRADELHPGPAPFPGAKRADAPALLRARAQAAAAAADEALLCDAAGHLVEGGRSNLVVVAGDGRAVTPSLARGAVAGIARALALERCPELAEDDVWWREVARARELVALNAVRGARPIVRLDGAPVGNGAPGSWARRLAQALAADEPL